MARFATNAIRTTTNAKGRPTLLDDVRAPRRHCGGPRFRRGSTNCPGQTWRRLSKTALKIEVRRNVVAALTVVQQVRTGLRIVSSEIASVAKRAIKVGVTNKTTAVIDDGLQEGERVGPRPDRIQAQPRSRRWPILESEQKSAGGSDERIGTSSSADRDDADDDRLTLLASWPIFCCDAGVPQVQRPDLAGERQPSAPMRPWQPRCGAAGKPVVPDSGGYLDSSPARSPDPDQVEFDLGRSIEGAPRTSKRDQPPAACARLPIPTTKINPPISSDVDCGHPRTTCRLQGDDMWRTTFTPQISRINASAWSTITASRNGDTIQINRRSPRRWRGPWRTSVRGRDRHGQVPRNARRRQAVDDARTTDQISIRHVQRDRRLSHGTRTGERSRPRRRRRRKSARRLAQRPPRVIIDVHKQPGYNINQTVQRVKDALPGLTQLLPPSIKLRVLGDRTQTIRASVDDVQMTMAISIALVCS